MDDPMLLWYLAVIVGLVLCALVPRLYRAIRGSWRAYQIQRELDAMDRYEREVVASVDQERRKLEAIVRTYGR